MPIFLSCCLIIIIRLYQHPKYFISKQYKKVNVLTKEMNECIFGSTKSYRMLGYFFVDIFLLKRSTIVWYASHLPEARIRIACLHKIILVCLFFCSFYKTTFLYVYRLSVLKVNTIVFKFVCLLKIRLLILSIKVKKCASTLAVFFLMGKSIFRLSETCLSLSVFISLSFSPSLLFCVNVCLSFCSV